MTKTLRALKEFTYRDKRLVSGEVFDVPDYDVERILVFQFAEEVPDAETKSYQTRAFKAQAEAPRDRAEDPPPNSEADSKTAGVKRGRGRPKGSTNARRYQRRDMQAEE